MLSLVYELIDDKTKTPSEGFFRTVVDILGDHYSYVYKSDPVVEVSPGVHIKKFPFRGTGGPNGLKNLPKVMRQAYKRLQTASQKEPDSGLCSQPPQPTTQEMGSRHSRKRQPHVPGVDQDRFYATAKRPKLEFLKEAEGCAEFVEQELLFEQDKETVQDLLRNSVNLSEAIPNFFADCRHIQRQYEWVTRKSILENIAQQLSPQLEFLKKVLLRWRPTQDFHNRIETAKLKSDENNSNPAYVHICLLRELNHYWEETRCGLLRYSTEEPLDSSPHIVISEDRDGISFGIWAEGESIIGGLTLTNAVAVLFHLSFVVSLKYPKKGDSVAVWLQRKVAGIGCEGEILMKPNKIFTVPV